MCSSEILPLISGIIGNIIQNSFGVIQINAVRCDDTFIKSKEITATGCQYFGAPVTREMADDFGADGFAQMPGVPR